MSKSYIRDTLYIYYVHPNPGILSAGESLLEPGRHYRYCYDTGWGIFGGLLFGYALKKIVKLIAVIVGLFIAGLAYLQYQQIASFNWNKIEGLTSLANTIANTFNDKSIETLGLTNFGIPLTSGMSAGFAIGFLRG
jgi:uncharacterized membrane protein (Fun14 family)